MISLSQIESDLKEALKARDQIKADTLRGLKARVQNEQTGAGRSGESLSEAEMVALVRSEVKRRKDAALAFQNGGRQELAEKELKESGILEKYLPAQMPESQVAAKIEEVIIAMSATPADFGKVMGKLKAELGDAVDGATLARLLKEILK